MCRFLFVYSLIKYNVNRLGIGRLLSKTQTMWSSTSAAATVVVVVRIKRPTRIVWLSKLRTVRRFVCVGRKIANFALELRFE